MSCADLFALELSYMSFTYIYIRIHTEHTFSLTTTTKEKLCFAAKAQECNYGFLNYVLCGKDAIP